MAQIPPAPLVHNQYRTIWVRRTGKNHRNNSCQHKHRYTQSNTTESTCVSEGWQRHGHLPKLNLSCPRTESYVCLSFLRGARQATAQPTSWQLGMWADQCPQVHGQQLARQAAEHVAAGRPTSSQPWDPLLSDFSKMPDYSWVCIHRVKWEKPEEKLQFQEKLRVGDTQ